MVFRLHDCIRTGWRLWTPARPRRSEKRGRLLDRCSELPLDNCRDGVRDVCFAPECEEETVRTRLSFGSTAATAPCGGGQKLGYRVFKPNRHPFLARLHAELNSYPRIIWRTFDSCWIVGTPDKCF